ncbi:uncharacterized protein Dana_GF12271, isoform A [Drosophila ananassae]|uniref:Uncharacterized protein, isoform A n=1 Tax=Drosophila ananassae TaxID=7217 RepID=B3MHJ7_DROAN|nr:uncharacterized protein LOC6495122 isoform X1 [Drosophila ananassae]EDV35833.1 uncharacterized protein Dana_GF12271, isoform A [Drosophila ananassae]
MGSSTRTWILLGLMAGVATLSGAANVVQSGDQRIIQNNGNTFLSNGAGQIIRRPDGKTVLIGSDGRSIITDTDESSEEDIANEHYSNNNVIINGQSGTSIVQSSGHNYIYGDGSQGSYITQNGRSIRIVDGGIELNENGQIFNFKPKGPGVNTKETVDINGQPAQVEYSNGDIVVELADHTVIAKIGGRTFMGDRYSFDNREKLEVDAQNMAARIHEEVNADIKKTMEDLHASLQNTFANIRF